MTYPPNKQQGIVLLSTLLIIALCVMLITRLIYHQRLFIHQVQLTTQADQLYLLARLGTRLQYQQLSLSNTKSLQKHIGKYFLQSTITPQTSLFNLNCIASNPINKSLLQHLIHTILPNLNNAQSATISQAVAAWITPKFSMDNYYLTLPTPYRPAHQTLTSISELRLIKSVNQHIFNQLKPYITALPVQNNCLININDATAAIIMLLDKHITFAVAATIANCIKQHKSFSSVEQFLKSVCAKHLTVNHNIEVTTLERYYLVTTRAHYQKQTLVLQTLLKAYSHDQGKDFQILWQEINGE